IDDVAPYRHARLDERRRPPLKRPGSVDDHVARTQRRADRDRIFGVDVQIAARPPRGNEGPFALAPQRLCRRAAEPSAPADNDDAGHGVVIDWRVSSARPSRTTHG